MFAVWGRRGATSQFALDAAHALKRRTDIDVVLCLTRQNEIYDKFQALGIPIVPIDTFSSGVGAVLNLWRIPQLRRHLSSYARRESLDAVIEFMPHVWSPLLMPAMQVAGVKYATIIHDAAKHPGDLTGLVKPLLDLPLRTADRLFTLSTSVADILLGQRNVSADRLTVLFHPDFAYSTAASAQAGSGREPFKILFLGRIMPYKGLALFVGAIERLKERGYRVEPHVYGEGSLGPHGERLAQLGAHIVNRWLAPEEIATALRETHAVMLSHIEASQSGVAAAAFGAGVPVVATPVGGLREQIQDGETGILAKHVAAEALADAAARLIDNPGLYRSIVSQLDARRESRSMERFLNLAIHWTLFGRAPDEPLAAGVSASD